MTKTGERRVGPRFHVLRRLAVAKAMKLGLFSPQPTTHGRVHLGREQVDQGISKLQLSDLIGDKPMEPLINDAGQVSSPTGNAVSEITSMRKAQAISVSQITSRFRPWLRRIRSIALVSRCYLVQRTCLLQQTRQGFHLAVNCCKSEYRARLSPKGVLRVTRGRSEINQATHSRPGCKHLAISGGRQ